MPGFNLDFQPLKEPLGFIKVLEWLFSIFVFVTCGGYKGKTTLLVSCHGIVNKTVTAAFAYPFRLNKVAFSSPDPTGCNGTWTEFHLIGNFASSSQFFVTFAVMVFMYCITALVFYLCYMHRYRNCGIPAIIDYIFTLFAMCMWLISTAAWARALVDIKVSTGPPIVKEIPVCQMPEVSCVFGSVSSMGSLNVSVVFGLLNMILWGGNSWFVYKETCLYKRYPNLLDSGLYPPVSRI